MPKGHLSTDETRDMDPGAGEDHALEVTVVLPVELR